MSDGEQLRGRNMRTARIGEHVADVVDFSAIEMRAMCWHSQMLDGREFRRTFSDLPHSEWDETPCEAVDPVGPHALFVALGLQAGVPDKNGDVYTQAAIDAAYAPFRAGAAASLGVGPAAYAKGDTFKIVAPPGLAERLRAALDRGPELQNIGPPRTAEGDRLRGVLARPFTPNHVAPIPRSLEDIGRLGELTRNADLVRLGAEAVKARDDRDLLFNAAVDVGAALSRMRGAVPPEIYAKLDLLRERLVDAAVGTKGDSCGTKSDPARPAVPDNDR